MLETEAKLTDRECMVLIWRNTQPPMLYREIARLWGVTTERARQIEARAREKVALWEAQKDTTPPQTVRDALDQKRAILNPRTYNAVMRAFYAPQAEYTDDAYQHFLDLLQNDTLLRVRAIGRARLAELRKVFL